MHHYAAHAHNLIHQDASHDLIYHYAAHAYIIMHHYAALSSS